MNKQLEETRRSMTLLMWSRLAARIICKQSIGRQINTESLQKCRIG